MSLIDEFVNYGWTLAPNGGVENYGINVKFEESKKLDLDESNNIIITSGEPYEIVLNQITILGETKDIDLIRKPFINWLKIIEKNNLVVYTEKKEMENAKSKNENHIIRFYDGLFFSLVNEKIFKRNPTKLKHFLL